MIENRPSKKQKELLSFIDGFIKEHGYVPSYREIMRALNYKSVSTVATHIDGLVARGYLRKSKNAARSLEVLTPALTFPTAVEPIAQGGARQEIEAAIKKLQKDEVEEAAEAVQTLTRALEILGYAPAAASASEPPNIV